MQSGPGFVTVDAVELAIAIATLALVVALAVLRPRAVVRFTPGSAALVGVAVLLATRLLPVSEVAEAARVQWRPLLALTCILVMTGVVQEVGAFDRLAALVETRARRTNIGHAFTIVFVISVITPALLNNDAAILILTPIVVALTRRLYPGHPEVTLAFAFAVFLAPGVAPFIVSNPMNMIVAEFAGLHFNSYAAVMLPISAVGALLTYAVLRRLSRGTFAGVVAAPAPPLTVHARPGERPAVGLMLAVFAAYPLAAALGIQIWYVAVAGAAGSLVIAACYRIAPLRKVVGHVSIDILVFLWGIFLVVRGLQHVGVVTELAALYHVATPGSGAQLVTIGATSALGSALIDNHPMSLLNMMAIDTTHGAKPLLAALVGGDIGPRLLPIGSLAGLLWIDLLRRAGISVGVARFARLGTLVLLPTLAVSLALLWLL